ncbi:hypothetical protein NT6N_21480 [Oceaniferula spumae]|uniref:RNA polymerase subunit sigma-70 n=1 Tax=Oceaniferula spumae TaxID=2979115 RepID=A0AAT9FMC9_9BACT
MNTPEDSAPAKDSPANHDDLAGTFAVLMMKNRDALSRYLFSLHPITDEVDDLLQNTALTLWKKIDDYDQTRDFLPWALRFAYFEVLRWRKHMRKRRFVLSDELVSQLSDSASTAEDLETARFQALHDCLAKLPSTQRQVVDQRYTSQGTLKALAEKLGVSIHKVYHTLDDARDALATCVERKLIREGYEINQASK